MPPAPERTAGRAWEWAVLARCLGGACPVPRRRLRHRSTIAVRPIGKLRHHHGSYFLRLNSAHALEAVQ